MSTTPTLIERILPEAGIVGSRTRREIARELEAHLEDLRADCPLESAAYERFGDPREIASAFAQVYRAERLALYTAGFCAVAAVSWGASAAIVGGLQFILATVLGFSTSQLFSPQHLVWESVQMAALTVACLGIYFAERWFQRWRLLKAAGLIALVFGFATWMLQVWEPGHGRVLPMAFLCAFLVRVLQAAVPHWLVWLGGAAIFGGLGLLAAHSAAQALFASIWIALAACCQFTILMAGAFERYIQRRHFA